MKEKYQDILSTISNQVEQLQSTVITNYRYLLSEDDYKEILNELYDLEEEIGNITTGIDEFTDMDLLIIIGRVNDSVSDLLEKLKLAKKENLNEE